MRKMINAELDAQSMKLRQLEANVTEINTKMCYVSFDVSGFHLEYVYNINDKGNYFLERIKPYPLALREFDDQEAMVDIIEIDVEQFRNAIKSHNINEFIEISRKLNQTILKFEDLFLYYNVPKESTDFINQKMSEILAEIDKTTRTANRLYFKKDPDNLIVED